MNDRQRTTWTFFALIFTFSVLAGLFLLEAWGRSPQLPTIPLVDPEFTKPDTVRRSYADLVREEAEDELFAFECYLCHEEGEPPPLRFDEDHKLIIPDEHSNIVLNHGQHDRNNNCFNCHNEHNLLTFETRDGRELGFAESTHLCGSCHGPTLRDWEAGVHGRTGGYWDSELGELTRQDCVSCHDPHSPAFPSRRPAPGPHPLHMVEHAATSDTEQEEH